MNHRDDCNSMSVDELWALHAEISSVLATRIAAEKTKLEKRLRQLQSSESPQRERRPYPQVFPKYRNPAEPSETWAGRGKQPRWVTAQLRSGKKLDDFRIRLVAPGDRSADAKRCTPKADLRSIVRAGNLRLRPQDGQHLFKNRDPLG
jgi:DNA-binding protein H-NS